MCRLYRIGIRLNRYKEKLNFVFEFGTEFKLYWTDMKENYI
jgi:hypothetical protein